ncbi:hypothetical protein CF326_g6736 [Tilletia indica]|nr:hypothetical protein CF326_g6736 [Tilletia indica]
MEANEGEVPQAPPDPPPFTPAQIELAQQLRENSSAWLQEQAQHQLSKSERHGALEMAYSILFTEGMVPKDAFESAVDQILTRRRLTEQMGVNLCPSSPPSSRRTPPPKKSKKKKRTIKEKAPKKRLRSKKKKSGRQDDEQSKATSPDKASSSSSSSSSESDAHSSASEHTDSSSSESSPLLSQAANWAEGKVNQEQWDALRVPLHICKKVHKGEFVDLWWFTPTTCRERHDDEPVSLSLSGNTLKRITKDRPKNFLEDVELSQSDFHWALDTWRDTMKDEGVEARTVEAWDTFNTGIKSNKQRDDPDIQFALQKVHHFQRESFANTTRRTKNMMKAIEASDWSQKKKEAELLKLCKFDPSIFPEKTFNEMITKRRADTLAQLKAALLAATNQQPLQPSGSGSQSRQQAKPFRSQQHAPNISSKQNKACALCGSRAPHDVRRCRSQRLAANSQPTFAIRDENDNLVTRTGRRPICIVPNGATWEPPLRHPEALQLNPEGWAQQLAITHLRHRYPIIVDALKEGLVIGIQAPQQTHISKHHNSALNQPDQVQDIIDKELANHRYLGPYSSRDAVEALIGPFQTAPLGLRPKPNGKFRLIQDFSHPKVPQQNHPPSVNSTLNIDHWPTTWYTFQNTCSTICSLPRTAQAFVRDVTSAFRQIPLHESQWPGTVVEWEGQFYIDLFLAFGLGPACGAFGLFADAFADICRALGIGPTGHWVDDNVFFRLPVSELHSHNIHRAGLRSEIHPNPTCQRGRMFWQGRSNEFYAEDYSHDIRVLPGAEDGYNCGIADIDRVSSALGWPWETSKDAPWASIFVYGGITFNIATREVSLPEKKRLKYLATIREWERGEARHQLHEAQTLFGQLQHATTVHEQGRFYLKGLLDFITSASSHPDRRYQRRHNGHRIPTDLDWWKTCLALDTYWRSFDPEPPKQIDCYCDGSTSYGAGVHIAGLERSFPLHPHLQGCVDIKTVESLALELAVLYAAHLGYCDSGIVIYSDSTPVCGAFKKGRMAAEEANTVLERISVHEQRYHLRIHLCWVRSEDNKADRPSRGNGSRTAGDQGDGDGDDPNKKHAPAPTHATPAAPVPNKARPWSKLAQQWKNAKAKAAIAKPAKKKSIKTRTFKAKNMTIETSVTKNRPKVDKASQRFSTWVPATPVNIPRATRSSTSTVRDVTLAGYAAGTQRNYSVGLAQWHKYCDEHKIEEKRREPAAAHLVEHWVSLQAGDKSGGYLSDWISGLKAWHKLNNLPWLADEDRLSLIRRGVLNLQPPPRPPRAPMTVTWLDQVYHAADSNARHEVSGSL